MHSSRPDWTSVMPFWRAVQRLSWIACSLSWMQRLDSYYRCRSSAVLQMQCVSNFTGYQYATGFVSSCATSSVTVWSALHQHTYVNSVSLPGKLCSISSYDRLHLVTSVYCTSQQTASAGEYSLWSALTFGTSYQLLHESPAPTHRTVSNGHWRYSWSNEWTSRCGWQHLCGTVVEGGSRVIQS